MQSNISTSKADTSSEPHWKMKGYKATEWRERKFFERHGTQQERDCMYISEFEELGTGEISYEW